VDALAGNGDALRARQLRELADRAGVDRSPLGETTASSSVLLKVVRLFCKVRRYNVSRATLTSKGQLTVPKDVRERLGLKSGDRVVFEFEGDSVRLKVEARRGLEELKGSLPATRGYPGKEVEREAAREHAVRETLGKS
jgi:antitoxin PrlF